MDSKQYYKDQINSVNIYTEYPAQIKIKGQNEETKWMTLNKESAGEIIAFLIGNYIITEVFPIEYEITNKNQN